MASQKNLQWRLMWTFLMYAPLLQVMGRGVECVWGWGNIILLFA